MSAFEASTRPRRTPPSPSQNSKLSRWQRHEAAKDEGTEPHDTDVLFDVLLFSEQFPFFFDDGAYESLDSLFSERGAGALEEQLCADAREERRRDLT
jgi:hypothetical protein